jgi:hypothetical protein
MIDLTHVLGVLKMVSEIKIEQVIVPYKVKVKDV